MHYHACNSNDFRPNSTVSSYKPHVATKYTFTFKEFNFLKVASINLKYVIIQN
jgi:hypothetical protein